MLFLEVAQATSLSSRLGLAEIMRIASGGVREIGSGFTEPANLENIELRHDASGGMDRTEVICKNCGAHLGHVFDDGPKEKGGKRYCINSVCLDLEKKEEK